MFFKQIYDQKLSQYAYLIGCQASGEAIIVDPLRDVDQYQKLAKEEGLNITAAVDTHIHADYLSGLRELAEQGVKVYASNEGGADWRYEWLIDSDYNYDLVAEGDRFTIGNIEFDVVHTPGHTPESVSLLVTDGAATDEPMGILTGDFVFVGDVGRPDLLETAAGQEGAMKPAAQELFESAEAFKELPAYLQVWPAHGSGSACGKALGAVPQSTVGYELQFSPAFKAADVKDQFIDFVLDGQPEPPLYFGRMKKVNKEGPAVLGKIPTPSKVSIDDMVKSGGTILDTRGKHAFMEGHLEGALLTSFDKNFNTIAGSYVDPDDELYLIIEEGTVDQAVRDLIRVGLDNVIGFATPEDLNSWNGGQQAIAPINFDQVEELRPQADIKVLDVRKATEFAEGHIPGAINIAHTRLDDHLDELPKNKSLLVHCGSGQRASYASALLARNGFDIQWVDDRFAGWQQKYSNDTSDRVSQ